MRPWDLARSALGVRGVFASLFDQRPSPPKATRGRPHTAGRLCALQKPATAGRNITGENLRKLRKPPSIAVRISRIPYLSFRAKARNLSTYFRYYCLASRARIIAAPRLLFRDLRSRTPCP